MERIYRWEVDQTADEIILILVGVLEKHILNNLTQQNLIDLVTRSSGTLIKGKTMSHTPALSEQVRWKAEEINDVDVSALGESMPRCRTKASKLGKIPNWTHDHRKPTLLGTILKNSVECESGIIACNDVVQNPEWK